jgi:hypothetical protein
MKKELVGILVCVMFLGVSLSPIISGEKTNYKEVIIQKNDCIPERGISHENLIVFTYQELWDFFDLYYQPHSWGIMSQITNLNREKVTIYINSTCKTKDGKILWEGYGFSRNIRYRDKMDDKYFNYDEFIDFNYRFGFFDLILDIYVPETETDITIIHHGLFLGIFSIIFNPFGEMI